MLVLYSFVAAVIRNERCQPKFTLEQVGIDNPKIRNYSFTCIVFTQLLSKVKVKSSQTIEKVGTTSAQALIAAERKVLEVRMKGNLSSTQEDEASIISILYRPIPFRPMLFIML